LAPRLSLGFTKSPPRHLRLKSDLYFLNILMKFSIIALTAVTIAAPAALKECSPGHDGHDHCITTPKPNAAAAASNTTNQAYSADQAKTEDKAETTGQAKPDQVKTAGQAKTADKATAKAVDAETPPCIDDNGNTTVEPVAAKTEAETTGQAKQDQAKAAGQAKTADKAPAKAADSETTPCIDDNENTTVEPVAAKTEAETTGQAKKDQAKAAGQAKTADKAPAKAADSETTPCIDDNENTTVEPEVAQDQEQRAPTKPAETQKAQETVAPKPIETTTAKETVAPVVGTEANAGDTECTEEEIAIIKAGGYPEAQETVAPKPIATTTAKETVAPVVGTEANAGKTECTEEEIAIIKAGGYPAEAPEVPGGPAVPETEQPITPEVVAPKAGGDTEVRSPTTPDVAQLGAEVVVPVVATTGVDAGVRSPVTLGFTSADQIYTGVASDVGLGETASTGPNPILINSSVSDSISVAALLAIVVSLF
jgi:hypothetical protein